LSQRGWRDPSDPQRALAWLDPVPTPGNRGAAWTLARRWDGRAISVD
jgi:hypothetical protein